MNDDRIVLHVFLILLKAAAAALYAELLSYNSKMYITLTQKFSLLSKHRSTMAGNRKAMKILVTPTKLKKGHTKTGRVHSRF